MEEEDISKIMPEEETPPAPETVFEKPSLIATTKPNLSVRQSSANRS
jgi:hypothetical protein